MRKKYSITERRLSIFCNVSKPNLRIVRINGGIVMHQALRRLNVVLTLAMVTTLGFPQGIHAQAAPEVIPGQNVNVIGGPTFIVVEPFEIAGDPWRNQQVEPYCAISSRNPAVVFCSAVDYRLVDLDGGGLGKVHPDSWNMVAQSKDAALTFVSTLVPGHLLDPQPNVLSKYDFAADPIVHAGAAGVFYHIGLVSNRESVAKATSKTGKAAKVTAVPNPASAIYFSTWIHLSDREDDLAPVKLVTGGITEAAIGNAGQFVDRPDLAVGLPNGGTCTFEVSSGDGATVVQTVPATPAYLAYTTFVGHEKLSNSQIHFTKTMDCGSNWTHPIKLTSGRSINVGPQVVKLPGSDRILVFWRRGATKGVSDAIMVVRSDYDGDTFTKPEVFAEICPFDQLTSPTTFRVRAAPSVAADPDRAYVVWSDRRDPTTGECTGPGTARVLMSTTPDGVIKTAPVPVDSFAGPGHQIFPTVAVAENVHVAWLDFRNDASDVFEDFVDEISIVTSAATDRRRHTADMRATQAIADPNPQFPDSVQVSQYIHGKPLNTPLQQIQWNVQNIRNFGEMFIPFNGDFLTTTTETVVPADPVTSPGVWAFNGMPGTPPSTPVFHSSWTDGRNVHLLSDEDYGDPVGSVPRAYTPPDLNQALMGTPLPLTSLYDPAQTRPMCEPNLTGTKNLEIYTSRSTHGFFAFAPWNNKAMLTPENEPVQRAFVIVVQNTETPSSSQVPETFDLNIVNQPPPFGGSILGRASFNQFNPDGTQGEPLVDSISVDILPGSAIARTVYVTSSNPQAAIQVNVSDEASATRAVFFNPDPSAPLNPLRPGNVDQTAEEFDINFFEVHDVDVSNIEVQDIGLTSTSPPHVPYQGQEAAPDGRTPGWQNPGWQNPGWQNPGWQNPGWQNPGWQNPGWQNPGWQNPGWQNFTISDDEAAAGSVQVRATYTNTGNTTSSYDARMLLNTETEDFAYQLVVYKLYTTTAMTGCAPDLVGNTQVLVNFPNLDVSRENFTSSEPLQNTSFSLHPGETAYAVLVIQRGPGVDVNALVALSAELKATPETIVFSGTPDAINTADVVPGQAVPTPQPTLSQPFIADIVLPDGQVTVPYPATGFEGGGNGTLSWSWSGNIPPGLMLDSVSGIVTGNPTTDGTFNFIVTLTDASSLTTKPFSITVLPLSDLIVATFTHSPANPTTETLITFSAVVENIGAGPSGTSSLEFRVGGETFPPAFAIPALAPGESFEVTRQETLGVAQGYLNTATADIDDDVAESDETNNVTTDSYVVVLPPPPIP